MNREEYNKKRDEIIKNGNSVFTADAVLTGDPVLSALALAGSGNLSDMQRYVSISKLYRNAEKLNEIEKANTEVYNNDERTL